MQPTKDPSTGEPISQKHSSYDQCRFKVCRITPGVRKGSSIEIASPVIRGVVTATDYAPRNPNPSVHLPEFRFNDVVLIPIRLEA